MKEYKLKQYYPSLPSDWKNVEIIVVVEREHHYILHPSNKKSITVIYFGKEEIENNPEFWEEIKPKEKEYEILTFLSHSGFILKNGGTIPSGEMYPELLIIGENLLKGNNPFNLKIHSVKRLSDGEIFTIGDTVTHKSSEIDFTRIVEGFDIYKYSNGDSFMRFVFNGGVVLPIKEYDKIKPLYTTDDGKEVFEGDTIYYLDADLNRLHHGKVTTTWKPHLSFSTKKAAEEYIIREKPILNANEIYDVFESFIPQHLSILGFNKLKEKIREKLGYK